ncbi:bifunctional metallophosphatase/5'-nucleotidase [Rhodoferax sp.]|uniref:bifunctional metallophosphatase/5'-nucleotidase n=1 Tax=Rhodoferax sp. TaxID=50421 RepID=UPI00276D518A|nr:bifunctional metallophosphatase/5'-nucleotidase [Rhodoferax sp.]
MKHFLPTGMRALALGLALVLGGCATVDQPPAPPRELSIFSINDFHGHLQDKGPVPLMARVPNAAGELKGQPAGGVAHLATVLQGLRAQRQHSVFVAAGDLIGATPLLSSLLKDEPTLAAMGELGLVASALGNHELDAGLKELQRKTRGECPPEGCAWPGFKGAGFPYLAANMLDAQTGLPVLPTHLMRDVAGLKVAFVGAVTRDTPMVVLPSGIRGLRFADEVQTLNALVPQLRAEGAQVLIAVMHEGASHQGAANDPSYACPGLQGRGVEIAKRLDKAYAVLITGHTHQAYTCKIDGRLVVQAGSNGGWLTETRLKLSAGGELLDAQAINHPVLQAQYLPNPAFAALVRRAGELTASIRNKPIAQISRGAQRSVQAPFADSTLGNLIADAQLAYAKRRGAADVAFMNPGGIRADLTVEPGRSVTLGDLFAVQPFSNDLVVMSLTGAQLRELLQRQLPKTDGPPRLLQVSHSLSYRWTLHDGKPTLGLVQVDGQALDLGRSYRVVVNNFMAEGGDGHSTFNLGRDRVSLGMDIDALSELLAEQPQSVERVQSGRIVKE